MTRYQHEELSIETPAYPTDFIPYDHHETAPVGYEKNHDDADDVVNDDDDEVDVYATTPTHGRSPRFWLLCLGAFVIVAVAVGAGVGAAMSGGGGAAMSGGGGGESSSSVASVETRQGFDDIKDELIANSDSDTTNSDVFNIILTHARFHGEEFKNPESYQSRAARWVEETAVQGVHTDERLVQRYALACLYFATSAVESYWTQQIFGNAGVEVRGWIDETGWLVDDDECQWYGITCNDEGFVGAIQLSQNRLTGSLPPELTLLQKSLEIIDLYNNPISNDGPAGNDWLGELTNLKKLYYGRTYFQYDGVPTAIGLLSQLEEYDCSYTLYHGPLRGEAFEHLYNLAYLHIGGNRYNSSLPWELATLPQLQFLYVEYSDLTGDISFIQDMPAIIELWMDRNPMVTGPIPSEIGQVTTLRSLSVTQCSLTGIIPEELGDLRLQQLWMYGNFFDGSMPDEVCSTMYPNGKLMKLEADCSADGEDSDSGDFQCSCCTCCGLQCAGTPSN